MNMQRERRVDSSGEKKSDLSARRGFFGGDQRYFFFFFSLENVQSSENREFFQQIYIPLRLVPLMIKKKKNDYPVVSLQMYKYSCLF